MQAGMRPLLLDTNLLLLYLVGGKDPLLIANSRRLNAYEESDYYLLISFIEQESFDSFVSTPHILTEASNLLGQEKERIKSVGREAIREYIQHCKEIVCAADLLVDEPEFQRLGLTDVAIKMASRLPVFVLTVDALLYHHLSSEGLDAVNFNHVRQGSW